QVSRSRRWSALWRNGLQWVGQEICMSSRLRSSVGRFPCLVSFTPTKMATSCWSATVKYRFGRKGDAAFWAKPVPGDDASLVWQRVHPYRDLPKTVDPPSGWVQSSNSAPWYMTMPFLNPSDYPAYMSFPPSSPEGALAPREASGLRMIKQVPKMSFDTL